MAIGDRKKIIIDTDPGIGIYLSPFYWIRFDSDLCFSTVIAQRFWIFSDLVGLLDPLCLVELLGFTDSDSGKLEIWVWYMSFFLLYFTQESSHEFILTGFDDVIDDAMAIFVALNSPEADVIGLTTIFGNVYTTLATRNALHLVSFLHFFLFIWISSLWTEINNISWMI